MNKYILKFSQDVVEEPAIAKTILETKVVINILRAKVDYNEGTMVVSIEGDEKTQSKVVETLRKKGVSVSRLRKTIVNDLELCVSCGACISVCPAGVLSLDSGKNLVMEKDKCHRCGICVDVCPRRSLSIQEHNEEDE
jgi:formate hydrogenlyase subunit 6/NADH:ubiquinone oxidoreductase subunit I